MSKPILTMVEAQALLGKVKSGALKTKNKKCLIIANEPDNSIVFSMRENAGIVLKVRFDTLAVAIANELDRVKEAKESADEEKSDVE